MRCSSTKRPSAKKESGVKGYLGGKEPRPRTTTERTEKFSYQSVRCGREGKGQKSIGGPNPSAPGREGLSYSSTHRGARENRWPRPGTIGDGRRRKKELTGETEKGNQLGTDGKVFDLERKTSFQPDRPTARFGTRQKATERLAKSVAPRSRGSGRAGENRLAGRRCILICFWRSRAGIEGRMTQKFKDRRDFIVGRG